MDTGTAGEIVDTAPKTRVRSSSGSTNGLTANGHDHCPRCGNSVYDAEKIVACSKVCIFFLTLSVPVSFLKNQNVNSPYIAVHIK